LLFPLAKTKPIRVFESHSVQLYMRFL